MGGAGALVIDDVDVLLYRTGSSLDFLSLSLVVLVLVLVFSGRVLRFDHGHVQLAHADFFFSCLPYFTLPSPPCPRPRPVLVALSCSHPRAIIITRSMVYARLHVRMHAYMHARHDQH